MISDADVNKLKTVFATKDDLKGFATKDDVQTIIDQVIRVHDEQIDQKLTQFRSDIFNKLDQVIGELQTSRQEREVIAHQVSDHEDRLTTIETKLQLA